MLNETIGWIGNILFAICGLPQVIKTYKTKRAGDLSALFLWMWLLGELLTFIYVLTGDWGTGHIHIPLYFNYIVNMFMACYLVYAKYSYQKKYPQQQ
jgi:uncharacterized protein with PQ loop repeat